MKTDLVVAGFIFFENKVLLVHHKKLDLWLPVGGHIKKNETPDGALLREIKEETKMDVEILNQSSIPLGGNINKSLTNPFYVNVHSAGDHEHCCFFYVCKALNPENLQINDELKNFGWFSNSELSKPPITSDVKNITLKAFELLQKLKVG